VITLGMSDMRRVIEFLNYAAELQSDHPFDKKLLLLMRELIPSVSAGYAEMDRKRRTVHDGRLSTEIVGNPDPDRYFDLVQQCPMVAYRDRTGDPSAMRITDLMPTRTWRELELYRERFWPYRLDQTMEVGLPAAPGRDRLVFLWRGYGERDFSDRDREVLEIIRPHLVRRQELAELRARVSGSPAAVGLTPREREILGLVAQGKTNAEVAADLWVAPSTVKKHLENVYEKLGVSGRAAAVAHLHRAPLH
jgi:DNA-binding CsgD family transcriptional regulator